MMGSMGGVRKHVVPAALAALLALVPATTHAAIFDDGNDRQSVAELRRKPSRSAEEQAVLDAADKVGGVLLCNRKRSANASLIKFPGCPANGAAIVTSAHVQMAKRGKGDLRCSWEDARRVEFVPNRSYYDITRSRKENGFALRRVDAHFPPVNWNALKGKFFNNKSDMAVYCLKEDVTEDTMPDGRIRGYLDIATSTEVADSLYMIGTAPDFTKGYEMAYQMRCGET